MIECKGDKSTGCCLLESGCREKNRRETRPFVEAMRRGERERERERE